MRFLKLKPSRLALVFSIVVVISHLGIGYLLGAVIKNQMLASLWHRSLSVYWPAMVLIQTLGLNVNVGVLVGMGTMILAALLQWWAIFSTGIWLIRLYFRNPPISTVSKIAIPVIVLVVAVCFYKASPEALGDPRGPLERAVYIGDTQKVEKLLKTNPLLANKPFRFGNETPLFAAVICNNSKGLIDLLIASGAEINAKSGAFNLTPLQEAAWSGKLEAVKALLAHKPDVNAATEGGDTALNYAFSADNKEIFNLLLENGADINHGRSVLAACMINGGKDSWPEFLLSKGADPNRKGTTADRSEPIIIQAIISRNTNYVAALLRHHVDLNLQSINGAENSSPVELAMDEGRRDIALMILNYALDGRSNTVSFAAARGDVDRLRNLLQNNPRSIEEKDELGFTPLAWAAEGGQKDCAELLLALGADPNATTRGGRHPVDWAASEGHLPLVELLAARGAKDLGVALYLAIQQQQVPVARFLLEHGEKPNVHYPAGSSTAPLHLAARQGNVEEARLLLEHGAQIDGVEQNNSTPLDDAVGGSSKEMVELLFANGATIPNKGSWHWSVFHEWALGAGDANIANVLLSHKADVNARGSDGQTPLHFAAHQGTIQAVEWLLNNGADVNAKDGKGVRPLSLTKIRNRGRVIEKRKDIADLLRKYGAKE